MSNFNFGSLANIQVSSNNAKHLRPYTITKVKWEGVESVSGGSGDKTWKALDFMFSSEDGEHRERVFIPNAENPKDTEDREMTLQNGGKKMMPSRAKEFMQIVGHFAGTLNPKGFEKLQQVCAKIKTFDELVSAFTTVINKVKGAETNLKLVGRNSGGTIYAAFPNPIGVNSNGEFFPCNIIGENLFFNNWEEKKRKEYLNAKPTNVSDNIQVAGEGELPTFETTNNVDEDDDDLGSIDFDKML
jgi:hypothetical protein